MDQYFERTVLSKDFFPLLKETLLLGHKIKFTVSGSSMYPLIVNNRDQVLIERIDGKRLKIGDIILFQNEREHYILHRIYKKAEGGYRTIGDSCILEDGFVEQAAIIGRVTKIYRKDKILDCNRPIWRIVFRIWIWCLPIKDYLFFLYHLAIRLKCKIKRKGISY